MLQSLNSLFLDKKVPLNRQQYMSGLAWLFTCTISEWILLFWRMSGTLLQSHFFGSEAQAIYTIQMQSLEVLLGVDFPFRLCFFLGSILLMRKIYQSWWKGILLGFLGIVGLKSIYALVFNWVMQTFSDSPIFFLRATLPSSLLLPVALLGLVIWLLPFFRLPQADKALRHREGLSPQGFTQGFWFMALIWWGGMLTFIGIMDIRIEDWEQKELLIPLAIHLFVYLLMMILALLRLRNAGLSIAWTLIALLPPLLAITSFLLPIWADIAHPWLLVVLNFLVSFLLNLVLLGWMTLLLLPEKKPHFEESAIH